MFEREQARVYKRVWREKRTLRSNVIMYYNLRKKRGERGERGVVFNGYTYVSALRNKNLNPDEAM